jgi:excisionase family DNA binding protein
MSFVICFLWVYLYLICTFNPVCRQICTSNHFFGSGLQHTATYCTAKQQTATTMNSNIKVQRICERCGKDFTARTTVTRYCSHKCNSAAHKAKAKAAKVETSNRETLLIKTHPFTELKAKEYLTIAETCKMLSVSRWTVWRAIKSQDLPAGQIGRRKLIKRADLETLFNPITAPQPENATEHPVPERNPGKPTKIEISNCYSTEQVRAKFGISESALRALILKHNIPKVRKGWFAYVPKTVIDPLFTSFKAV